MSILMSLSEFQFLTKDNYSNWQSFIQKFLCGCGHQLWDVVTGSYTRADAQDKQKFDVIDRVALDTIRRAIDKEVHPWVSEKFTSSKELWDYIELKFQRQEQKKMKKRAKQKQRKLKQRELADFLILPVPNIADDSKNLFGFYGDMIQGIGIERLLEQSHISSVFEGHTDLQLEQSDTQCIKQLALPLVTSDIDSFLINEICSDVPAHKQIQQLEVPILDEFLDFADLSSVSPTVISDYAGKELVLECIHESSFGSQSMLLDLDLQYEVIESNWFLHNDDIADLVSGDEQHTGLTHEFMAEEEEIICELPWLEIDRNSSDFQSHLSQVCTYDLPFHVNVHIPFACPHDGKVADQHLDDFSWYISYVDSEGISKQLQVTSRCLHLRNRVLLVFDTPAEGYESMVNSADSLPQQFVVGLPGQTMAEFSKAYYDHDLIDCSANSLPGQNMEQSYDTNTWFEVCYGRYTMKHFSIAGTRGTIDTFDILSAREWYRGRKIWSKIKYKDHSWLLLWLSLLYVTSTA